jgi:N-acetylmuramic acid 6-phosphate etherase
VIAGGDFALVKAVEGFEDFTAFGRKQLADLGVSRDDVVFAMTEGGETPFVIGTAWGGVEAGAAVHFVYNNPDDVLSAHLERSRAVLQDPRIEKINLTTGPMAVTGSTRMQATTIQLCVLLTVMEMVVRDLSREIDPSRGRALAPACVPRRMLEQLTEMHAGFDAPLLLRDLAALVALEESAYRARHRVNYYAEGFAADVLTDTTERSPTFSTPPFRRFDDPVAVESWAFLFAPEATTSEAWEHLLERRPRCVEWSRAEVQALVDAEDVARTMEIVEGISCHELMRFKIGLDGLAYRRLGAGDAAIGIVNRAPAPGSPRGFPWQELEDARAAGARAALIAVGDEATVEGVRGLAASRDPTGVVLPVRVPSTDLLLGGVERVGLKMLLNALSTSTMALLGRVMGYFMACVVPSNLKLIDRATRYVAALSGLSYVDANRLLFEVIEHVEPRLKTGQAYPPVVGLAVLRARQGIGNEEAERRLAIRI